MLMARWVPHFLNSVQKRIPMQFSQQHLDRFQKNKAYFVRRFVTIDEAWAYH